MIAVWRIGYCADPTAAPATILSQLGFGSTIGNGRWHTKAPMRQVVYCGSNRAICHLEKRVHSNGARLKNQALMRLELPAHARILDIKAHGLPEDWRTSESWTQALGNSWIDSMASLGLWVPSYIEPGENNLLLNPAHADYGKVTLAIERHPFTLDPRLFTIAE